MGTGELADGAATGTKLADAAATTAIIAPGAGTSPAWPLPSPPATRSGRRRAPTGASRAAAATGVTNPGISRVTFDRDISGWLATAGETSVLPDPGDTTRLLVGIHDSAGADENQAFNVVGAC